MHRIFKEAQLLGMYPAKTAGGKPRLFIGNAKVYGEITEKWYDVVPHTGYQVISWDHISEVLAWTAVKSLLSEGEHHNPDIKSPEGLKVAEMIQQLVLNKD